MSTELHKQLEELAGDLGSNTTHVLLGLAQAGLKIINIDDDEKLHLPKYLALARLARTYSEKKIPYTQKMTDKHPKELENTTMTNTVTYATRTETSDLQFEGDVTSIRHNGECLLEKVEQLEQMAQESANQQDRLEKLAVGQEEISKRLRDHQKETAGRARGYNLAIIAIALTCLVLASYVVNRLNHLPRVTAALSHVLQQSAPRQYEIGQAVVDQSGGKWVVRGATNAEGKWIYKLQDDKRSRWVGEQYLGPVQRDGKAVFYDISGWPEQP